MASKDLKIRYIGDASSVRKAIGDIDSANATLEGRLKRVGSAVSHTGSLFTLGLTVPAIAAGKVMIDEATQAAQAQGQTEAALKSTGGAANVTLAHVEDLAVGLGHLSAVDDEVVQSAENVLLTFVKVRNETGQGNAIFDRASLAVANLSARMGKDLNSSAVLVGKALNDPIRGVTALRRVGVQLTDQQTALIRKMVESGNVMGAQKIILRELETEFGGSAKAIGDNASPLTKLNLQLRDLAEQAGPIVIKIVQKISDVVAVGVRWFDRLSPSGKNVVVTLAAIAAAAGPVLFVLGKLISLGGSVVGVFTRIGGAAATSTVETTAMGTSLAAMAVPTAIAAGALFDLYASWQLVNTVAHHGLTIVGDTVTAIDKENDSITKAGLLAADLGSRHVALQNAIEGSTRVTADQTAKIDALTTGYEAMGGRLSKAKEQMLVNLLVYGDVTAAVKLLKGWIDNLPGYKPTKISTTAAAATGAVITFKGWLDSLPRNIDISIAARLFRIEGFQHGTPHAPGGLAMVGEAGPELVALPRGAAVFPASMTRQLLAQRARAAGTGASGGSVVYQVTIHVAGNIVTERDLTESVRNTLIEIGKRNGGGVLG